MQSQYDTTKLKERVNQVSAESGGKGVAGLYRHPQSGQEMHTQSDPLFGEAQSNAAVQLGFVRVRDSKPEELKKVEMIEVANAAQNTDSLKGLSARMAQLEGVQEKNVVLEKELAELRAKNETGNSTDHSAVVDSVAAAKAAAERKVAAPAAGPTGAPGAGTEEGDEVETPPAPTETDEEKAVREADEAKAADDALLAKPLDQLKNATELKRVAELENVDLTNADTNKKMRQAIQVARDAKQESEN